MADENNEKNSGNPIDLSGLGSFDFTPAWAKSKPDDTAKYARFEEREERREERGARRDDRGPRREDRGFRRDERGPRREDRGFRRDERGSRRDERPARAYVRPLDVEVRILPSQKDIGVIINRIRNSHLAYPLKQLAYFFLDHPEACVLRLSPKKDAAGAPVLFHQCKACGFVAFNEEDLLAHVVSAHLCDYYQAEEIPCEPPKGVFTCIAKCGLSGELLGPPNLHGYDARIREMIRTKFPNMREDAYRARIEMVRGEEVVEQWRATATKKTVYKKKGEPEAQPVEREAAEFEFQRMIAPSLTGVSKSVDLTADVALKSPSLPLVYACRDALQREKRFPASLFFALRGAFHHRKLVFFRANEARGQEFVTAAAPAALDTAHAIPELVSIVEHVAAHPGVTQQALLAALGGGDAAKAKQLGGHLAWLVEKGHLVGYANGVLAVPAEHPLYRAPAPVAPTVQEEAKPEAEVPSEGKPEVPCETVTEEAKPEEVVSEQKEEVTKDETADQLAE